MLPASLTPGQIDKASRYLVETRDALVESAAGLSASQWAFKPAPDCRCADASDLIRFSAHGTGITGFSRLPRIAPGTPPKSMNGKPGPISFKNPTPRQQ